MSVSINNLFNYSRSLPVPFDTMTNKKVKVASMYGAKTESTLCGSVIKAVHAMCRCMNGTGEGAVGQIDTNKSVAEYKSSVGPDAYHLVVFDAASGSALASVYDKNTELIEQYVAHPSQRDGAAIFFALMPFLMSDAEFDETFQEYYDQFIAGYPDMAKATESMAILCDNAYRRIKDDTCPAGLAVFGTLVLGAHAYGVTELEGGGLEHIVKQLGYGDDPLNQRASVGWKGMRAAERLVEQYMVRIESVSSYSTTAAAN